MKLHIYAVAGFLLCGAAQAATVEVKMIHDQFSPGLATIHAGDTIVWRNMDGEDHTITLEDGSLESGGIGPGKAFSHLFATPGKVGYDCSLHVGMHGDIVVVK